MPHERSSVVATAPSLRGQALDFDHARWLIDEEQQDATISMRWHVDGGIASAVVGGLVFVVLIVLTTVLTALGLAIGSGLMVLWVAWRGLLILKRSTPERADTGLRAIGKRPSPSIDVARSSTQSTGQ